MSRQPDPWDAMVQNDDSDQEYVPTGADGTDDEDQDFGRQDDNYFLEVDEDDTSDDYELGDLGDVDFSPCTIPFFCETSSECGTGRFA